MAGRVAIPDFTNTVKRSPIFSDNASRLGRHSTVPVSNVTVPTSTSLMRNANTKVAVAGAENANLDKLGMKYHSPLFGTIVKF